MTAAVLYMLAARDQFGNLIMKPYSSEDARDRFVERLMNIGKARGYMPELYTWEQTVRQVEE